MSQPKTKKKAPANPPPAPPPNEPESALDGLELAAAQTAAQKDFLSRVSRLLVNIQSPRYGARAARHGYSAKVHAEGWKLWSAAAGMDRPLDHFFSQEAWSAGLDGITSDRLRLLQAIDTFENTWFPRVRMIIRRMVPRDRRDAFAAAFFTDLAQQPLGPGVVGSVSTLLKRVEALAKSDEPGAKKVFATLQERGLTARKIAEVRALLKEVEEGNPKSGAEAPIRPEEIAAAQAAQQEAFEDLKDWWADWGTHLRSVFNVREQIVLGLTQRNGRSALPGDEEDADAGAGEEADELASQAGDDGEELEAAPAPAKTKPRGK